ncbi:sigma-70 region 4 domain-containing protein [Conexibacter stalactiti]|uniref:Sigma-70 region 4 domain-containing protein n=1 Tax=Conexibacter stalactiti TaxID=1940611 RepID=A0ABU4HTN3_9ACTN|nr:sigma-70 region 4 domain-containing protein [Conexibacter stalactiti]MDW5596671.1 sigma-70 region 4 domain-containing protein [Conexibacter stalactiti]MEC5037313.1 sigma-70 region 4 domain-containing protein [Conexibacter stalactiti]
MSAIETLPPDQRAVLQLILKQGRGYADLSGLLRIDEAAVRARAHAGLEALAPAGAGAALSDERRAQIGDWLLGQQDDDARAETLQHLSDSRAARRFARALHEQLAPFASGALPELPAAARNGAAPPPAEPKQDAPPPPPPPRPAPAPSRRAPEPRRSSKLGGALLIAGVAVLIVVVLVILINGGGDDDEPTTSTPTAAQTQATRTTAGRGAATDDTTILQQVNLRAPGGGETPIGIAFILLRDERPVVAVQVEGIPANGADDVYATWLRNADTGSARFLGYFPGQVGRDQRFTVSAPLPRDTAQFNQIVISQESIDAREAPARPASIVLQGTIRVNRTG